MHKIFLIQNGRKKIAVFLMALFLLSATPVKTVHAGYWGESFMAMFSQVSIEKILAYLEQVLQGIAKRLVVELAVRKANDLTGDGHKNGPSFITDYKRYIYSIALDESMVFANDFLTETLGGKASGLVYTAATGGLQSLGRNYMNYLAAEARNGLTQNYCTYSLDQYTNDPILSLQTGDWRVFNAILANPCNNPAGYTNEVKRAFEMDLQKRAELAKTKAIASQGFIGTEKNGIITAPGVILKDLVSNVQKTSLELIPNANGWGEILAAGAGAFTNQLMTNLFQKGFESVAKKVDRELGKVDGKVLEARRDLEKELGPGANFFRNINQQTGGTGNWNIPGGGQQTGVITWPTQNCTVDQGC